MENKRKALKKCVSMLLSMTMVLSMALAAPGIVPKAEAADTVVSELNLNYDMDVIELNTAWTEGEVKERLRENISIATDGVCINKINSWLKYKNEDGVLFATGDGTGQVKPDQTYYIQYCLDLLDGYVWPEGISEGDYSAFTVNVNGVDKTSEVAQFSRNSYYNSVYVTIPIGEASDDPIVTSVTINESNVSVAKGMNYYFAGEVHGTVDIDKILWSVEGKTSSATKIVEDKGRGHLTVGEDETAETIIVKATALANSKKYATVTVTITEKPPTIDSVTVTPDSVEILQGASQKFYADVRGTQADKSVTWSVVNAESDNTTIDQNGKLIVGSDETAETIIVKATANRDSEKSGTATVTVKKGISVNELNLTYDLDAIDLNVLSTESEVQNRIRNTINTTTEGVKVNTSNSWLMYKLEGGNFSGIGDGTNFVKADQIYYTKYGLEIPEGYHWPNGVIEEDYSGLTVKVNGVDKTEEVAGFSINAFTGMLYVTVPIGIAKKPCTHNWDAGVVTESPTCTTDGEMTYTCTVGGCGATKTEKIEAGHTYNWKVSKKATASKNGYKYGTCSACGAKTGKTTIYKISKQDLSYTKVVYNGTEQVPELIIKDSKGNVLEAGTDYTVTKSNGRINVGRYKFTITYKGDYAGKKTLYYTILPKAPKNVKVDLSTSSGGYDDVKVTWDKSANASGYRVYYKKATSSKWTYAASTTKLYYTKKNLSGGYEYDFKVVAYYKTKTSSTKYYDANDYNSASICTLKKLGTPTVVKASDGEVKVTWKDINGETGYQISQAASSSKTTILSPYEPADATSRVVSAPVNKTRYYKVRAYKEVNGEKVFGPWSKTISYKLK